MKLSQDSQEIIASYLTPNFGSILEAWLHHALTTKSKARFAREMRFHIPELRILWLDVCIMKMTSGGKPIKLLQVLISQQDCYHLYSNEQDLTAENVVASVGNGLTMETPVDLGFGHVNRWWQKPKEKAILGIPEDLAGIQKVVAETVIVV